MSATTLQKEAAAPTEETAASQFKRSPENATPRPSRQAAMSVFRGVKAQRPHGTITLFDFANDISEGTHREAVEAYQLAKVLEDARADEMKKELLAVTLSGTVTSGGRAKAMEEGRFDHNGLLQVDIDHVENPAHVRDMLGDDPRFLTAFISPSGDGVKAVMAVPVCKTPAEHLAVFQSMQQYMLETYGIEIDGSTKDPARLCFVSYDPDIWFMHEDEPPEVFQPMPAQSPQDAPQPPAAPAVASCAKSTSGASPLILRAPIFPPPPEHGIHSWLMEAAWHCRLHAGMTEAETVAKLQSYDGTLRRRFQPTEVADAVRKVFSTVLQSYGTRATIDRIREVTLPDDFPDLTRFGESDADNALRVHAVAGGNFHHVAESGQWLVWDGCRWSPDKDGKMVRLYLATVEATAGQAIKMENRKAGEALVKHAMRCRDAAKVASALTMLKSVQGVTISANDLDADPWLIGTPSGLIDLRTGHPIPPDKRALVTKSIACDFDPEATCPTWERVIHTAAAGDAELIRFLQAWTGYTLTGSVKEECLAFLHGTGANSKGTVTECIRALMGDYAMTAPESLFVVDRNSSATNDIARLSGCRMACAAELDESASFAESRLKAITGRDAITARFLHREFFDFQPTHKFWISGNHKPSVRGVDHGIWRRIRLIPFTVTIPKEERDLELADKLRAELPGILNWAIAGCLLWQREGLQTPQCVAKATADYQATEDVVGQFLDDCTDLDDDDRTLQSSLYQCYQAWAEKQGIKKPLTATMLNRKLEERGMKRGKVQGGIFWHGITIKSD